MNAKEARKRGLGCARGILFALLFDVALLVLCWAIIHFSGVLS